MKFSAFGYCFGVGLGARREMQRRDADWGEEWRAWPRVERCERTGEVAFAEAFIGPAMFTMEYADTYWWDDVRLPFGHSMSIDWWYLHTDPPRPLRRRFWIDREAGNVALGCVVLWFRRRDARTSPGLADCGA